ncbi:MAG TPA: asparaginase [Cerasibacillus sp.]|uniref:asparaginase n=1 Tax=Cerasibacillus sp. TaxID=2498711 RepID=UPI002F430256
MNHSKEPILVYRGDYIESTHQIHIAVMSAKGELVAYYGDPHRLTFARSSMKAFQALPVVESSAMEAYDLTERELSLFCASHIGELYHRDTVATVLNKLDLQESHLQCGTHIPRHQESYEQLIQEGGNLTPLFSNCSGKHAGMLAGCKKQGFPLDTYRDVTHPYQQQIIDAISDISGYPKGKIATSVDGCGVPVHRLPLDKVALLFARLASPGNWDTKNELRQHSLDRIRQAMVDYPEMVAGTKQFDTDLMRAFKGRLVAKGGAEAVHCFGDKETGLGVAIKVEDGNARGTRVTAMEVLHQLGIGDESIRNELEQYVEEAVLNARDEKIGKIITQFQLNFL